MIITDQVEEIQAVLKGEELRACDISERLAAKYRNGLHRTLERMLSAGLIFVLGSAPCKDYGGGARVNIYSLQPAPPQMLWLQAALVQRWPAPIEARAEEIYQ